MSRVFPYDKDSRLYLYIKDKKVLGIAKTVMNKKLYESDSFGGMKMYESTGLIDFFVSPDNDLLKENSGAKEFFEAILTME